MIFLRKSDVILLHGLLIERFGGSHGLLNEGALESALVAAENRGHYEAADLVACAATYAYHLVQSHSFVDGNKRVGASAMETFLLVNDARLKATDDEIFDVIMDVAAGRRKRDEVESWLRARVRSAR